MRREWISGWLKFKKWEMEDKMHARGMARNHRMIEQSELEGPHKNHQIQLLAL